MFNDLIKSVVELGIITASDVERLTAVELMLLIVQKVNALINKYDSIEDSYKTADKTLQSQIDYLRTEIQTAENLINEGVSDKVETILTNWLTNGTLNELLSAQVVVANQKARLLQNKYLGFTFSANTVTDPDTYLQVLSSQDGCVFEHVSSYTGRAIRDPFVFEKDGAYYVTGTNLVGTTDVTYLKTTDFINYEEVTKECPLFSGYVNRWAPSVINVNGTYYMVISLGTTESVYSLYMYVCQLSDDLVPLTVTKIEGTGLPSWCYDGHVIFNRYGYYIYFKREGGVDLYYSETSITSGYRFIDTIDSDNDYEAPFIIKPNVNVLRVYSDTWQGQGGVRYRESYDDGVTWSDYRPIVIKGYTGVPKHFHIMETNNSGSDTYFSYEKYNKITTKWGISQVNNTLNDLNDISLNGYLSRYVTIATANQPDGKKDYAYANLHNMGNNHFIQEITYLTQEKYIRAYVDGVWSTYKKVVTTDSGEETFTTFDHELMNGALGTLKVQYRKVGLIEVVSLTGEIRGLTSGLTTICTLGDKFRPSLNLLISGVNATNWDRKEPFIEITASGDVKVAIRDFTEASDVLKFTVTYLRN